MRRYIPTYWLIGIMHLFLLNGCSNDEDTSTIFLKNSHITQNILDSIRYSSVAISPFKSDLYLERFKIVHISDIHLADWTADNRTQSPQNLIEAVTFANMSDLKINALVATGDLISNNEKVNRNKALTFLESFYYHFYANNKIPSFIITGNHDTNMLIDNQDFYVSKQDLYQTLFASTNYPTQHPMYENYYYADLSNPLGGTIRIIGLDCTDQDGIDYNSLQLSCITQSQINWLTQTALKENMTDQHHIIILIHQPLQPYSSNGESYMCAGNYLFSEKLIPDIINAFIKKEMIQKQYSSIVPPQKTVSVNSDFTTTPGHFICYLGGHTHTHAHFDVKCNDPAQEKQIMLLANTMSPDYQNNQFGFIQRKKNTQNSNSFSIYAIDTHEQKIYTTYFGAKKNGTPTIETISYR